MPNLSIEPGIMALAVSMGARAVFANLIDRFLKGQNDEGETNLKLDVLAGNLGMSRPELHGHLGELVDKGFLALDLSTVESANLLRLSKMSLSGQVVEDLFTAAESKDAKAPAGKANRRKCGSEEAKWEGSHFLAEVAEKGEAFSLSITRTGPGPEGENTKQVVFYVDSYLTPEEAWNAWDNYRGEHEPKGGEVIHLNGNGKSKKGRGKKGAAPDVEGEELGEKVAVEDQKSQNFDLILADTTGVHVQYISPWTKQTDLFKFSGEKGCVSASGEVTWYAPVADVPTNAGDIEAYAKTKAEDLRAKYLARFDSKVGA